jgi:hypothetical protein
MFPTRFLVKPRGNTLHICGSSTAIYKNDTHYQQIIISNVECDNMVLDANVVVIANNTYIKYLVITGDLIINECKLEGQQIKLNGTITNNMGKLIYENGTVNKINNTGIINIKKLTSTSIYNSYHLNIPNFIANTLNFKGTEINNKGIIIIQDKSNIEAITLISNILIASNTCASITNIKIDNELQVAQLDCESAINNGNIIANSLKATTLNNTNIICAKTSKINSLTNSGIFETETLFTFNIQNTKTITANSIYHQGPLANSGDILCKTSEFMTFNNEYYTFVNTKTIQSDIITSTNYQITNYGLIKSNTWNHSVNNELYTGKALKSTLNPFKNFGQIYVKNNLSIEAHMELINEGEIRAKLFKLHIYNLNNKSVIECVTGNFRIITMINDNNNLTRSIILATNLTWQHSNYSCMPNIKCKNLTITASYLNDELNNIYLRNSIIAENIKLYNIPKIIVCHGGNFKCHVLEADKILYVTNYCELEISKKSSTCDTITNYCKMRLKDVSAKNIKNNGTTIIEVLNGIEKIDNLGKLHISLINTNLLNINNETKGIATFRATNVINYLSIINDGLMQISCHIVSEGLINNCKLGKLDILQGIFIKTKLINHGQFNHKNCQISLNTHPYENYGIINVNERALIIPITKYFKNLGQINSTGRLVLDFGATNICDQDAGNVLSPTLELRAVNFITTDLYKNLQVVIIKVDNFVSSHDLEFIDIEFIVKNKFTCFGKLIGRNVIIRSREVDLRYANLTVTNLTIVAENIVIGNFVEKEYEFKDINGISMKNRTCYNMDERIGSPIYTSARIFTDGKNKSLFRNSSYIKALETCAITGLDIDINYGQIESHNLIITGKNTTITSALIQSTTLIINSPTLLITLPDQQCILIGLGYGGYYYKYETGDPTIIQALNNINIKGNDITIIGGQIIAGETIVINDKDYKNAQNSFKLVTRSCLFQETWWGHDPPPHSKPDISYRFPEIFRKASIISGKEFLINSGLTVIEGSVSSGTAIITGTRVIASQIFNMTNLCIPNIQMTDTNIQIPMKMVHSYMKNYLIGYSSYSTTQQKIDSWLHTNNKIVNDNPLNIPCRAFRFIMQKLQCDITGSLKELSENPYLQQDNNMLILQKTEINRYMKC